MRKSILLHLRAFVCVAPVVAVFSEGSLWVNTLGLLYFVWLAIWMSDSPSGRRFVRDYYAEVLRIEHMLTR